jgi:cell cycle arrest protein BUB2
MPQPSWGLGGPEAPSSPRTMRTLRKIQSHQVLTTSSALIAQTQSSHLSATRGTDTGSSVTQSGSTIRTPARRPRSNSDAAAREASLVAPVPTQRRPARKTGSGVGIKRSLLENLVRDGPQNGNTKEALQELKYLVLSTGVDADGDGMVSFQTCACGNA